MPAKWVINENNFEIDLKNSDGTSGYPIDLERFHTSAQILDIIIQVSKKTWATNDVVGKLVKILDHWLDIQQHYCSGGASEEFNPTKWLTSGKAKIHSLLWSDEFDEFYHAYDKEHGDDRLCINWDIYAQAERAFLSTKGVKKGQTQ